MNTKPLLIVRFPEIAGFDYNSRMKHIHNHPLSQEYHVLFLMESGIEKIHFETHNILDYDEVKMEELEQLIKNGE